RILLFWIVAADLVDADQTRVAELQLERLLIEAVALHLPRVERLDMEQHPAQPGLMIGGELSIRRRPADDMQISLDRFGLLLPPVVEDRVRRPRLRLAPREIDCVRGDGRQQQTDQRQNRTLHRCSRLLTERHPRTAPRSPSLTA